MNVIASKDMLEKIVCELSIFEQDILTALDENLLIRKEFVKSKLNELQPIIQNALNENLFTLDESTIIRTCFRNMRSVSSENNEKEINASILLSNINDILSCLRQAICRISVSG